MSWIAYFVVLSLAHLAGDFLLQTNHQALRKVGGLGRDPVARRALFGHISTYALPIIGALIWIGERRPGGITALAGALILLEHLVQDDGRLLASFCLRVKRMDVTEWSAVAVWVDQTFHLLALFGVALLLTA
jgi:hypothetical protein